MLITRTDTIEAIIPIFREYLMGMSRFYKIMDIHSWCEGALKKLQKYSRANDRLIYILKESESIIGFAFVNQHFRFNHDGFAISEFYVQKEYERQGCGRRLAEYVFAQHPGNWEVAVSSNNKCALLFWKKVVLSYTSGDFMEKKISSFRGDGFLFSNY